MITVINYFLSLSLLWVGLIPSGSQSALLANQDQDKSTRESTGVTIKLVPIGVDAPPEGKPYQIGKNVYLRVFVTNNSDAIIRAIVVDTYYQNRPRLYKDGKLVPYRAKVAELVRSKDASPHFVRLGSLFLMQPTTRTDLQKLDLDDWYEPLEPGLYRLINRCRFEVRGHWSVDSEELLFEVLP
jgi:hypothetical protein